MKLKFLKAQMNNKKHQPTKWLSFVSSPSTTKVCAVVDMEEILSDFGSALWCWNFLGGLESLGGSGEGRTAWSFRRRFSNLGWEKSYEIKPKSDCIYHGPIDLEQRFQATVFQPWVK